MLEEKLHGDKDEDKVVTHGGQLLGTNKLARGSFGRKHQR